MDEPIFSSLSPSGLDLLALAREYLQREILPALPPERRDAVRMIDRAIGIAMAEAVADPRDAEQLAASLAGLGFADLAGLAAAIRSGALDDDAAVEAWLGDYVRMRLSRLSAHQLPDESG